jgi:class 3 adenylate cyclase
MWMNGDVRLRPSRLHPCTLQFVGERSGEFDRLVHELPAPSTGVVTLAACATQLVSFLVTHESGPLEITTGSAVVNIVLLPATLMAGGFLDYCLQPNRWLAPTVAVSVAMLLGADLVLSSLAGQTGNVHAASMLMYGAYSAGMSNSDAKLAVSALLCCSLAQFIILTRGNNPRAVGVFLWNLLAVGIGMLHMFAKERQTKLEAIHLFNVLQDMTSRKALLSHMLPSSALARMQKSGTGATVGLKGLAGDNPQAIFLERVKSLRMSKEPSITKEWDGGASAVVPFRAGSAADNAANDAFTAPSPVGLHDPPPGEGDQIDWSRASSFVESGVSSLNAPPVPRPSSIAFLHRKVTILFIQIQDLNRLSRTASPSAMVQALNGMYTHFDRITMRCGVYKVFAISNIYLVAAGVPEPDPYGAVRACDLADQLMGYIRRAEISLGGELVRVRMGMSTGPVAAGVIGKKSLNYHVFGDTVNVASRMCSEAEPFSVFLSEATKADLDTVDPEGWGRLVETAGTKFIKGKGEMPLFRLDLLSIRKESPRLQHLDTMRRTLETIELVSPKAEKEPLAPMAALNFPIESDFGGSRVGSPQAQSIEHDYLAYSRSYLVPAPPRFRGQQQTRQSSVRDLVSRAASRLGPVCLSFLSFSPSRRNEMEQLYRASRSSLKGQETALASLLHMVSSVVGLLILASGPLQEAGSWLLVLCSGTVLLPAGLVGMFFAFFHNRAQQLPPGVALIKDALMGVAIISSLAMWYWLLQTSTSQLELGAQMQLQLVLLLEVPFHRWQRLGVQASVALVAIVITAWVLVAGVGSWTSFEHLAHVMFILIVGLFRFWREERWRRCAFLLKHQSLLASKQAQRLLRNMLPSSSHVEKVLNGVPVIEHVDFVGVLQADIVGYTELSAKLGPEQLLRLLNHVYSAFDSRLERHKLYKIDTIGDAVVIVSGLQGAKRFPDVESIKAASKIQHPKSEPGSRTSLPLTKRPSRRGVPRKHGRSRQRTVSLSPDDAEPLYRAISGRNRMLARVGASSRMLDEGMEVIRTVHVDRKYGIPDVPDESQMREPDDDEVLTTSHDETDLKAEKSTIDTDSLAFNRGLGLREGGEATGVTEGGGASGASLPAARWSWGNDAVTSGERENPVVALCQFACGMHQDMERIRELHALDKLSVRIGIHVGPVIAAILGSQRPRYCIWGSETVVASALETNSLPGKTLLSGAAASALADLPDVVVEPFKEITVDGATVPTVLLQRFGDHLLHLTEDNVD